MSSGSESEAITRFRETVQTEKVTISVQTHPYTEFRNIAVNWGNGFALEVWQNIAMQTFEDHCGETPLKRHNENDIFLLPRYWTSLMRYWMNSKLG